LLRGPGDTAARARLARWRLSRCQRNDFVCAPGLPARVFHGDGESAQVGGRFAVIQECTGRIRNASAAHAENTGGNCRRRLRLCMLNLGIARGKQAGRFTYSDPAQTADCPNWETPSGIWWAVGGFLVPAAFRLQPACLLPPDLSQPGGPFARRSSQRDAGAVSVSTGRTVCAPACPNGEWFVTGWVLARGAM